jgi:hypothetical protein
MSEALKTYSMKGMMRISKNAGIIHNGQIGLANLDKNWTKKCNIQQARLMARLLEVYNPTHSVAYGLHSLGFDNSPAGYLQFISQYATLNSNVTFDAVDKRQGRISSNIPTNNPK